MTFFCLKTLAQNVFMCYNKYIMLNKTINKGNTMTNENKYQIDTLLWNTVAREEGDTVNDIDEHEQITFEVIAEDEKSAWIKGEDYMYTNYNQELHNADTTITKVGA